MDGAYATSVFGTENRINNTNRPINTSCGYYTPLAWSTAHVRLGNLDANWAETGWEEEQDSFYNHIWYAFTEWGLNYTTKGRNDIGMPCTFTIGGTSYWYVESSGSTGAWSFYVDCNDGTGAHFLKTYSSTGYQSGWAMGETGRYGGTATGMSDVQQSLSYRDVFGNWYSWGGVNCYSHNASNWGPYILSSQSYKVYQGSYSC